MLTKLFSLWCLGVHQGKVAGTTDDGELNDWCACLHRVHIMPSIEAAASLPASTMDTANILWSLAACISCTSEGAEHQNKTRKKNKAEKRHPTSRRLVLNAASTYSDSPSEEIPPSYFRIINSNTEGMADRELQTQMRLREFCLSNNSHN